jgi:hypothetical protein
MCYGLKDRDTDTQFLEEKRFSLVTRMALRLLRVSEAVTQFPIKGRGVTLHYLYPVIINTDQTLISVVNLSIVDL